MSTSDRPALPTSSGPPPPPPQRVATDRVRIELAAAEAAAESGGPAAAGVARIYGVRRYTTVATTLFAIAGAGALAGAAITAAIYRRTRRST